MLGSDDDAPEVPDGFDTHPTDEAEFQILMGMRTARQVVTGLGLSVAGQTMEEFRGSAT